MHANYKYRVLSVIQGNGGKGMQRLLKNMDNLGHIFYWATKKKSKM
jgi:hypothetical protein